MKKQTTKIKKKVTSVEQLQPAPLVIPLAAIEASLSTESKPVQDKQIKEDDGKMLNELLTKGIEQYRSKVEKEHRTVRADFDVLRNVATEFLDDFIIIGHSIDDQRVIIRNAKTTGEYDKLNELCKKVFLKMVMQEQSGSLD